MQAHTSSIYKQLLPGLFLGLIVLIGLALLGNINHVTNLFGSFQWLNFLLAIALNFLNQALRFLKRAINFHQSGVRNVSFLESMVLFLICLPLSVTPTRVGESFKGIWLFKRSGIPVERAVSVFMVEQIADGLSVFVLMVIGTIAYPSLWPLFLSLFLAFVGMLIYFKIPQPTGGPTVISTKVPILKRVIPQLRECIDANPALFSVGNMTISFLLGILSWTAEGAALFIILRGLGFAPSLPLIATSILVFAFSTTVSLASRLPGGLGVMEVAMAMLLTLLLNFQPEKAVAATILFRLATFWVTFIVGLVLWSVAGKSLGIKSQEGRIIEG
jgi:glycosyltransferase 2 family protein